MIYPPGPLATLNGGHVLYPTLGAVFHLEPLVDDDAARIEEANAIVLDWLGPELRLSWLSCWNEIEAFRPRDLDYAARSAATLAAPVLDTEEATLVAQNLAKIPRDELHVTVTGSVTEAQGSPVLYRFWSEIPEVGHGDRFRASGTLEVHVPTDRPLGEFYARVTAIAKCLRLRSGTAGLTYAGWPLYDYEHAATALYAHARRFVGFDIGQHIGLSQAWDSALRSVSWLTFVGPAFVDALAEHGRDLASTPLLHVSDLGGGKLIQAGPSPEAGDRNRMRIPAAYIAADELVRPLRAASGVDFGQPWTDRTASDWLRRFEGWR